MHGVGNEGFAQDDAHIDGGTVDPTAANLHAADESQIVVEEQHMGFFDGCIAELLVEKMIDLLRAVELFGVGIFGVSARAEFAGGQDGDGFGGTDAAVGTEFLDAAFAQSFQAAAAVVEQSLHEGDGVFAVVAAADENGEQFGR